MSMAVIKIKKKWTTPKIDEYILGDFGVKTKMTICCIMQHREVLTRLLILWEGNV